jgi:hypothetical protein
VSDEAVYTASDGWGGDEDFLAPQRWDDDEYEDLADDEELERELRLDRALNEKPKKKRKKAKKKKAGSSSA